MLTFFAILLIIAALVLMLFILAQNPKGGGLSSTFGGATQIVGARQTADFLEKATWYVAIGILAVILISNFFIPRGQSIEERQSKMQEQIENMAPPMPESTAEQEQGSPSSQQE
ncbi:MAG TPA: preprotein translocase subunit SecG [Bacteroidia bacterium]|nr:preprotein translocase subunit SecG [Sphingobacteriales bacterium]HPD66022.1 preprotein translocase subunit SecG [Bacteroidia bacterium]HRS59678.1 preprotein translocase subunit SecG [Bacteroidia bacterium]HRU68599.1 preprotein translocase subunit SecG [Bacteroidia bacterium]